MCPYILSDYDNNYFFISVLYCTLLAKAQSDSDRAKIVKTMESDPELKKILKSLLETEKDDVIREERLRKQAVRRSKVNADIEMAMEVDEAGVIIIITYYALQLDSLVGLCLIKLAFL